MSTSRPIGIVAGCVFCRIISSSSDSCCTCDQTSPRCAPSHAPRMSPRAHLDHRPVRAVVALAHQRSQLRVQPRPRPVDPRSCRVEAAARADIRRDICRDTRRGEQDTRARAHGRECMLEARAGTGAHPQFTSRTAQKKSVSSVSLRSDFEYDSNASHWPRFHAPAAASRATSARASASCVGDNRPLATTGAAATAATAAATRPAADPTPTRRPRARRARPNRRAHAGSAYARA